MTEPQPAWAVTRVANASVILEIGEAVVLTDPCFDDSPAFTEHATITVDDLPELTAIIGSHWAQDHWEVHHFAAYRHKETTAVFVADESMAESARETGFTNVETLDWGALRHLTGDVELEAIEEHVAESGMRTNNYALTSARARVFYGGEVLSLDALERYARDERSFDAAVGPVNGVTWQDRQLVVTAAEMLEVTRLLGAGTLVPIHDCHLPFEEMMLEIKSSAADLEALDRSGIDVVVLEAGETFMAGDSS